MNIRFIFNAVRRYGVRGIIDYIKRIPATDNFQKFLADRTIAKEPSPGITVIGAFDGPYSLSKTMRDLAIRLKDSDIPCQILNTPGKNPIPDSEYKHLLTPESDFITNKYSDIVTMQRDYKIPDKRCRMSTIEFWEFEDGFLESHPEMLRLHNIIAMSNFNFEVFKRHIPKANIHKVLYPFQFDHGALAPITETRTKYKIPTDSFAVFFNFDYTSSYFRKNPEAILRAFHLAFPHKENAVVVLKTMRAKKCQQLSNRLCSLARNLGIEQQLITIDDFIPQEDLVNLTNACDAYISLHRGEGFGIGIAEAMMLGKPVVVTNYSSTTEFCNPDNAIPIPYTIVPVRKDQRDVIAYKYVTKWAEPNIDAAARALRMLYDNPKLRERLGAKAKSFITSCFSKENFRKSIEEFLGSHL